VTLERCFEVLSLGQLIVVKELIVSISPSVTGGGHLSSADLATVQDSISDAGALRLRDCEQIGEGVPGAFYRAWGQLLWGCTPEPIAQGLPGRGGGH
jgi:hypothetical protein